MASSCVRPEKLTWVRFDTSKVAMSDRPSGTVGGVQLAAVFQSLLVGFRLQVALSANAAKNGNKQLEGN